jgi:hypothetical protein
VAIGESERPPTAGADTGEERLPAAEKAVYIDDARSLRDRAAGRRRIARLAEQRAIGTHTTGVQLQRTALPGLAVTEARRSQRVAPPVVRDVLGSPGRPLDPASCCAMEARFGHDFPLAIAHRPPNVPALGVNSTRSQGRDPDPARKSHRHREGWRVSQSLWCRGETKVVAVAANCVKGKPERARNRQDRERAIGGNNLASEVPTGVRSHLLGFGSLLVGRRPVGENFRLSSQKQGRRICIAH